MIFWQDFVLEVCTVSRDQFQRFSFVTLQINFLHIILCISGSKCLPQLNFLHKFLRQTCLFDLRFWDMVYTMGGN